MAVFGMTARHDSDTSLRATLAAFSATGESSSLYVLRTVTTTVDSMCMLERLVSSLHQQAMSLTEIVKKQTKVLDPDDQVIAVLETISTTLKDQLLPTIERKRDGIDRAGDLREEHRALLHSAYDGFIAALESWAESTAALRTAIIEHDLSATSGNEPSFDNLDDLFQSIEGTSAN